MSTMSCQLAARPIGSDGPSEFLRAAKDLASAARRLHAASASPPAHELRDGFSEITETLSELAPCAANVGRLLDVVHTREPHGPIDWRASSELERRMHEFISALSHARYSGVLAATCVRVTDASTDGSPR